MEFPEDLERQQKHAVHVDNGIEVELKNRMRIQMQEKRDQIRNEINVLIKSEVTYESESMRFSRENKIIKLNERLSEVTIELNELNRNS
jgi:hypothetical protein